MKNILVTGGLGFIGFNFLSYVASKYKKYHFVCLDSMTYASKPFLDEKIAFLDKHKIPIYKYSINDPNLAYVLQIEDIDTIINFAAESHVDNSITDPGVFITSNIVGVCNLLFFCKSYDIRFHQVSTDEVYGATTPTQKVDEHFELNPSSPYSASKASADMLTMSYFKTYGVKATISRCTNNFGPYQHTEKLLPKTICNALADKKIPVYGNGLQRRFWIHVDDHSEAIMKILENGTIGEIYNVAPPIENLVTNISMIQIILENLGKSQDLIEYVNDRPAHDNCYFILANKIEEQCGFKKYERNFMTDLKNLCEWYKNRMTL